MSYGFISFTASCSGATVLNKTKSPSSFDQRSAWLNLHSSSNDSWDTCIQSYIARWYGSAGNGAVLNFTYWMSSTLVTVHYHCFDIASRCFYNRFWDNAWWYFRLHGRSFQDQIKIGSGNASVPTYPLRTCTPYQMARHWANQLDSNWEAYKLYWVVI